MDLDEDTIDTGQFYRECRVDFFLDEHHADRLVIFDLRTEIKQKQRTSCQRHNRAAYILEFQSRTELHWDPA